mmetsp:Transcript_67407/g.208551  ORF Transcript_67407/g.208551 Transcript_67407/m.208551 type:complete len:338 (-) Transcript_67407:78-1091(-)
MGKVRSWLLWNLFLVRPLCWWLSKRAFSGWRCPISQEWSDANPSLNTTGLQVVVAGIGKDGTTSMQVALAAMGLRTYSAHEITFYLSDLTRGEVSPSEMVGPLRQCGVTALAPQNYLGLVPELVRVSPDVRVISMQRDWEGWRAAFLSAEGMDPNRATVAGFSLRFLPLLCHWLPLGPLWSGSERHGSFIEGSMTSWFIKTCLYEDDFDSAEAKKADKIREGALENRSEYEDLQEMIRSLVPTSRLLEFDVRQHGWPELSAFLGRPPPPQGTPFPRTMSGTLIMQTAMLALAPASFCRFLLLLLASLMANAWAFAVVAGALRRARPPGDRGGHGKES